jgi:HEAT repeat protein
MHRTLPLLVAAVALGALLQTATVADGRQEKGMKLAFEPPPPAAPPGPAGEAPAARDELLLRGAGLPGDGAGLLAYLRQRGREVPDPERLAGLLRALGSADPAAARRACAELLGVGPAAVPLLRQAAKDDAPAATALARRCLRHLETNPGTLSAAVLRLVALRRPPAAAGAVLAFLPHAEDETVLEEARAALAAVAWRDGKPDGDLLAGLEHPLPVCRGAAVEALCQGGSAEPRPVLRKLLADPSPSVRLRAALALAQAHDPKAVSTLITLLADLPLEQARRAEEYLAALAGEQAPRAALAADEAARRRCRDEWAAWWLASEAPGLVEEVRKRTVTDANLRKGQALIRQLGDDEFAVREKAEIEIRALGAPMVPLLRQALRHGDLEVRQRAEACLAALEHDRSVPLSPVTVRLIALRRPPGTAEALLAYLPAAEDEALTAELQQALDAVATAGGKADPALVRALADPAGARRGAAAGALCQVPGVDFSAVRPLLQDPDPAVRLKVALALAGAGEKEAVPVLIDLVGRLPADQGALAEEYLLRLAQDHPPALPPGGGEARQKRRNAWAAWWAAAGARVQMLPRPAPPAVERVHNFTLLVQPQGNQVVEVSADGKVRWQITGLLAPQDAEVVARDRVLVAEHNGQRVTERNLQGEVLWTKSTPGSWPVGVQRLRNGHTFIACRNQLLEVDRGGRELYTIARPVNDVVVARRLRDGQIVCVTAQRAVLRLDTAGKELKSFTVPFAQVNGAEVLPNGHVLLCATWNNRVAEFDAEGRAVWDQAVTQPVAACRLPGGNTLVALQQWPAKVVEMDRGGKVVGEIATTVHTYRLRRR